MRENEYILDGKHYIRSIKSCRVVKCVDGRYHMACRIHQRGERVYLYERASRYLVCIDRFGGLSDKKFWLSEEAEQLALAATEDFDERQERLRNDKDATRIRLDDRRLIIAWRRCDPGRYDAMIEYFNGAGENVKEIHIGVSAFELCKIAIYIDPPYDDLFHKPFNIAETLYEGAVSTGDEMLALEIKLVRKDADPAECAKLSDYLGRSVLPPLPEEYDRYYIIDSASISGEWHKLLCDSGYDIRHRPAFAMIPGYSTHNKWKLNPHTKDGVDAALRDAPAISFEEYLALFG